LQKIKVDLKKIAEKIVNDCLQVKPGENFRITCADFSYFDLAEEVALAAIEAQAYPFITVTSDRIGKKKFDNDIEYFKHTPVLTPEIIKVMDVELDIAFSRDPENLKDVDPKKLGASASSGKAICEALMERNKNRANLRSSSFLYPTPEAARKYGMSFEDYSDLIWSAIDIDYKALSERAKKIAAILNKADKIHVTTEDGTDLRFSVKDRQILIDDGVMDEEDIESNTYLQNLPTGEVYCAPIETSAEGTVVFQYNKFFGEPLVNLRGTFREGLLTDMSADEGFDYFYEIMENNTGEKYRIAELGIGLNPNVTKIIGNLALDEKIIGTIHIALGENRIFPGGQNEASIHYDFVMQKPTLIVDDQIIMENGEYRV
jgi:aminopeptidase